MYDETGPGEGSVGDVVGSMLGVEPEFDAGTGLPPRPNISNRWDEDTLDPKEVHAYLSALARDESARACVLGDWLLRGLVARVWEPLGYASFREYVERLFGWSPHYVAERLRTANALTELPGFHEALRSGRLNWSVVREVTRVVVPDTEVAWLEAVEGKTVREVEQMVRGRQKGDGPDDPADPQPERRVLRFEVNPETRAILDEARTVLTRDAGHHLSDDEMLQLLARAVVGVPRGTSAERVDGEASTDAGRSNYQISMTVCEKCRAGDVHAGGDTHRVRAEVVEAAECDANVVDGPRGTKPGRASQTIPPATRRAVVWRDKGCCSVPGCRNHHFIDLHHILLRSEGGSHDLDNLICLCGVHHQAAHDGRLIIRGTVSSGLTFHHADGSGYGAPVPPARAQPAMEDMSAHRKAFACLCASVPLATNKAKCARHWMRWRRATLCGAVPRRRNDSSWLRWRD